MKIGMARTLVAFRTPAMLLFWQLPPVLIFSEVAAAIATTTGLGWSIDQRLQAAAACPLSAPRVPAQPDAQLQELSQTGGRSR